MLTRTIKFGLVAVLMASTFVLSACNEYVARTNKKIETTLERAEEHLQQAQIPDLPAPVDTVRTKNDIWLGADSVKISEGDALPAHLEENDSVTLSIAQEATLPDLVQEITDVTGITVRLDNLKAEDAVPTETIPMNYSGKLSGLLNYLSNRYGVWWRYKSGIITFYTKETRVFNIYALPTETSISNSLSGATMGEGGGSSSSSLSSSANLALWDNIEQGLEQVVGEGAKLSFSRVAGTVTVTGSPFVIREAADWINKFNEKLSRQVAISVKVLLVSVSNSDNYGLDLAGVFGSNNILADYTSPFTIASGSTTGAAAGMLSMTLLRPSSNWKNSSAVIQAFSSQGKTSLVTSASVTTLNNKVAPVQITTQQNYVSESNVSTSGSGSDRSVDVDMQTDTLNYGFMLEILPRILDHGRLIIMFSMNLTDLIALEKFSSDGQQSEDGESDSDSETSDSEDTSSDEEDTGDKDVTVVQLPKMQTRGFIQEIAMRSGSTLVLTGFEQVKNTTTTGGIGRAKIGILGGQAYSENTRDVMVILLTPEVLESPLAPESRMRDF
ncbi:MAG: hypothetical protein IJY58_02070 [Alphaproteobacteria bacterium]|nr:hypothetical protein [Alphaproteobacteria bacterium]